MTMTAGTVFLMWLGEQIDEFGIGNGISLLIMAGILAGMPGALVQMLKESSLGIGGQRRQDSARKNGWCWRFCLSAWLRAWCS